MYAMHRFGKLGNLTVNILEINFYHDQTKWKHNLIPIEKSKNESDRVVDLLIYKNHYVFLKKLHVLLGNYNKSFIRRRCLKSYTSENIILIHRPKSKNNDITTIRSPDESHRRWKTHFHKNPL